MILYSYWRSSASYRVRIALNLKGLEAEIIPVDLLSSEQFSDEYTRINPEQRVPTFMDGEEVLTQSMAIIEYLEELHPNPALLPRPAVARARVRALSQAIACDISPFGNTSVLRELSERFSAREDQKHAWIRHWISKGLTALEVQLAGNPSTGLFCHGDHPTMADCCLVPQIYNARRFQCDLSPFPTVLRIAEHCEREAAFAAAHPSKQPDAM